MGNEECMRPVIGFFVFAIATHTVADRALGAAPTERTCQLVSEFRDPLFEPAPGYVSMNEGRADLWAHDVTGWDLIKSEELNTPRARVPFAIAEDLDPIALDEAIFNPRTIVTDSHTTNSREHNSHGTAVLHIIANSEIGLAAPGKLVSYAMPVDAADPNWAKWTPDDTEYIEYRYQGSTLAKIKRDFSNVVELANRAGARIINFSLMFGNWKPTIETLNRLHALIVTSAGNDPTDASKYKLDPIKELVPGIVVGGISIKGKQYGNDGDAVDILAPNAIPSFLPSRQWGHDYRRINYFGLTSGATPIVTATLINVLNLVPELDNSQLEALLKSTAVKARPRVGYVNSYKLTRVADRIRRLLERSSTSLSDIVASPSLLDFSAEAESLFKKARQIYSRPRNLTCADLNEIERLTRKAYLLDQKPEYRISLAAMYRTTGELSEFYSY